MTVVARQIVRFYATMVHALYDSLGTLNNIGACSQQPLNPKLLPYKCDTGKITNISEILNPCAGMVVLAIHLNKT
jgi:hypothetical protein